MIIDKAKVYDKFVEELKSKFKDFQVIIYSKNDLEKFFPELKESEDERIRKSLIHYLHGLGEFDYPDKETYNNWLTWLEKQGEQKSIDYNEELKKCRENPLYFFDKYVKLKLKEQTPAWSDEDEEIYNRICYLIHSAAFENYDVDEVGKELGEYAKITDWLKAVKTRCAWKPSEEQIDTLEHFVRSIGESGYASPYDNNTKLLYSLLEQLKKLKGE